MKDSKMFRTVLAVGAILMATGLSASAQANAAQGVKTVVLVHGAWATRHGHLSAARAIGGATDECHHAHSPRLSRGDARRSVPGCAFY
jgi:hypothetical protein